MFLLYFVLNVYIYCIGALVSWKYWILFVICFFSLRIFTQSVIALPLTWWHMCKYATEGIYVFCSYFSFLDIFIMNVLLCCIVISILFLVIFASFFFSFICIEPYYYARNCWTVQYKHTTAIHSFFNKYQIYCTFIKYTTVVCMFLLLLLLIGFFELIVEHISQVQVAWRKKFLNERKKAC